MIVIEHNLDVIKVADYLIDMGPGGGKMGGTVVCTGTPEEVARNKKSFIPKKQITIHMTRYKLILVPFCKQITT